MTNSERKSEACWTPSPDEVPKVYRLTRSIEVRRLLARLTEQLWSGMIDAKTANAITYVLATAARVINDEQVLAISKRIAALEERAGLTGSSQLSRRRLNA